MTIAGDDEEKSIAISNVHFLGSGGTFNHRAFWTTSFSFSRFCTRRARFYRILEPHHVGNGRGSANGSSVDDWVSSESNWRERDDWGGRRRSRKIRSVLHRDRFRDLRRVWDEHRADRKRDRRAGDFHDSCRHERYYGASVCFRNYRVQWNGERDYVVRVWRHDYNPLSSPLVE